MLTGKQIYEAMHKGLEIRPFFLNQLNPNSYNLCLHNELLAFSSYHLRNTYGRQHLDLKEDPSGYAQRLLIPPEGLVLQPNCLYLGRTVEWTESLNYVPMLEGRSSIARYGIEIHISAGVGDIGFRGYWTLEIICTVPVKIYPNIEICQIMFHEVDLDKVDMRYDGKYQDSESILPSRLHTEF